VAKDKILNETRQLLKSTTNEMMNEVDKFIREKYFIRYPRFA
jgi:hypothetical protein